MSCIQVSTEYFLLCFCHRERFPFLPDFFFNRTATTTHCYPTLLPFSPVPAVSNHLLPPAGPGPVVTRLIPVSKQTGEIPGPEAEAASMGTIENLFISFL